MTWKHTYRVSADFRPYLYWLIEAESASEARLELVRLIGIPYEQTEATL